MSFESTKKEWSELYAFFRLLADGKLSAGTPQAIKDEPPAIPIAMVQREEHDGTRRYFIVGDTIHMQGEGVDKLLPRADFAAAASLILAAVKTSPTDEVCSPDGVEEFLNEIGVLNLEAETTDRTDISIAFWYADALPVGFSIRSRLAAMNPLLDGGRAANLKLEQTGVKFAVPTVNKINALPASPTEVAERMMMIERLGGVLKYADVADKVFRANLQMIDLHFPRVLAEMLRLMHLDGMTRVSELTREIKTINPLKIKDDLISKHGFYEYKTKQFLLAAALGMRPAKIYTGADSAIEGLLLVDAQGDLLYYHKADRETFGDFLLLNTRLERNSPEKSKYGFLEKENGTYYFKLNLRVGLTKKVP